MMNDLILSLDKTYLNDLVYSFELLYRDLRDQEQLDIFTKNSSTNDACDDFIDSYFKSIITFCNN